MSAFEAVDMHILPTFEKRRLSYIEYIHACFGTNKKSLELPHENTIVLEGIGNFDVDSVKIAVAKAVEANPAVAIKLVGKRNRASWVASNSMPSVRQIHDVQWDGYSDEGSSFIYDTTLSLRDGVVAELILVEGEKSFLIFRSLRAVMDDIGSMHFLEDVFRAIRGEPLKGSNNTIKDTDLMQSLNSTQFKVDTGIQVARLTGDAQGDEHGDTWRRVSVEGPQIWLIPRIAVALAEFSRHYSDDQVLISVPVDMRRHREELRSTMNFRAMSFVQVSEDDSATDFHKNLQKMLSTNSEAYYMNELDWLRYLPFSWLELFFCRTHKNYRDKPIFETAMVSEMNGYKSADLSSDTFKAKHLYGIPLTGNAYSFVSSMDNRIDITIGMPKVYANNGRMDRLLDHLMTILR